ncbi:MAG: hypothetical protein GY858_07880 [Candidatus Omnitrophica bacterium]|nr:hypothetical protein [Candidatus Omnitrophota bacterium]
MFLKILILILFITSSSVSVCFCATIHLKDGKKVEGEIIERNVDFIKANIHGVLLTYYLDDIDYVEGSTEQDIGHYTDISQRSVSSSSTMKQASFSQREMREIEEAIAVVLDYWRIDNIEQGLAILQEKYTQYPNHPEINYWLGEYCYNKKRYLDATKYFSDAINIMLANPEIIGRQTLNNDLSKIHYRLVDCYNEIGQQKYFSEELCLRIMYHLEKTFELSSEIAQDQQYLEFLRKTIGHYDAAELGVRVLERGESQKEMMKQLISGEDTELILLYDGISQDEKLKYKNKAVKRLENYDLSRSSLYQLSDSDKTLNGLVKTCNDDMGRIQTIHYKKVSGSTSETLEEAYYKSPFYLKTITRRAISIFTENKLYMVDGRTNKVDDPYDMQPGAVDYLMSLRKLDIEGYIESRKLRLSGIKRIENIPEELKDLYTEHNSSLYLVTANYNETQEDNWPPIVRIEFLIDTKFNLIVMEREYWRGVFGSGRKEDLATETVIKSVQEVEGLHFPLRGKRKGFIQDTAHLTQDWQIEIVSLNDYIDDGIFDVKEH